MGEDNMAVVAEVSGDDVKTQSTTMTNSAVLKKDSSLVPVLVPVPVTNAGCLCRCVNVQSWTKTTWR